MNVKSFHSPAAGTVMTPNYLRSPKISVSPYCDCSNSGNNKDECDKFTEFFTDNTCLRELSPLPGCCMTSCLLFCFVLYFSLIFSSEFSYFLFSSTSLCCSLPCFASFILSFLSLSLFLPV